jgi:hypothetical protein
MAERNTMLEGSALKLLFPGGAIDRSAAGITDDIHLEGSLPALFEEGTGRAAVMLTLGAIDKGKPRSRGFVLQPLIDGDENDACTVGVWAVDPVINSAGSIVAWRTIKLGELTVTASLTVYSKAECGEVDASGNYRVCDAVAFTLDSGYATTLLAAYTPAPRVYSPGSNAAGYFLMPEAGGHYGIAFAPQTSGVGFNGLVREIS